jgi:hypothetical protein
MRTGKAALVSIAFAVGIVAFSAVTAFVPETGWKGFHMMFVLLAARLIEGSFGVPIPAHRGFVYALAAVIHGFLIAVLFLFALLFIPRLGRRGAGLTLAVLVIIDVVLLVLVSPMRELP